MKGLSSARKRAPAKPLSRKNYFFLVLPGACLVLLGALIFRDFIFGNAVLLYKDIGSDSLNTYYPAFVHLSDYLRNEGFPSWSFSVGMGQDLYYLAAYLILQPVSWLPRDWIASALVYQHLAKLLIAGLLFFQFLQLRGLRWPASLLGSLLLSGSGYMCMGSCWFTFADEVVCFAALLLAAEKAMQLGSWFILALAVALVGLLGSFHLYFCALFLLFYVPARLFTIFGWRPRSILRVSAPLAGAAILGVGLGAVITLPNLYALLNSPRGSGTTSFVARLSALPVFGFESGLHYITSVMRTFANDALGTADDFRGWGNYLEAPITYCGLLSLILFPQAFIGTSRRYRIIISLFLAAVLIPTIFPWFRYLFWAFQGDYFRTHSLFTVLGLITLCMTVFSRFLQGRSLNLWLLGGTTFTLLGVLYAPIADLQSRLEPDVKLQATILLASYALLLAVGNFMKRRILIGSLVIGIAAVELIRFDQITVARRRMVSKQELTERVGYNDETVDAVRAIKAGDNSFFRITKLRPSSPSDSTSLNDALIFRYYGTSSYSSFNNVNYTNFLTAVEAMPPDSETATRWAAGLLGHALLSMFACEKYALVTKPEPFQKTIQYELIGRYGVDYLFRNTFALPLGVTFNSYIHEDVFRQLSTSQKAKVLLDSVVLSDKETGGKHGLSQVASSELESEMNAQSLLTVVAKRRETALNLTSFRQSHIEGSVRLEQKSVLVVQTPFDRGWRALQDGKAAPVLKADIGLLGVVLEPGEHKIEIRYRTPFLGLGFIITLASCLILAASRWRWPRLPLPA